MSKRAYAYQAHRLLQGDPLTDNEFLLIKLYDDDTRDAFSSFIIWCQQIGWNYATRNSRELERTTQLERRIPHTHP